jgi:hypothetical protein
MRSYGAFHSASQNNLFVNSPGKANAGFAVACFSFGLIISYFQNTRKIGKVKEELQAVPLLEKVFLLLMGCSKNYIMYWGLRVLV